jgi:hypothetical protein
VTPSPTQTATITRTGTRPVTKTPCNHEPTETLAASPTDTPLRATATPTVTPVPGIDLRPSDVIAYGEYQSGCRGPLAYLSVCVENTGRTPSGPFAVLVQPGNDRFEIGDLDAQTRVCTIRPFTGWEAGGYHTFDVIADVDDTVAEVDEDNNSTTVRVLRPTIPRTCSPSATPTRTTTPSLTPRRTRSATPAGSAGPCLCLQNGGEPGPGDCPCNVSQCYHDCVNDLCPNTPNCTVQCSLRCTCERAPPECPDHEDPGYTPTPIRSAKPPTPMCCRADAL